MAIKNNEEKLAKNNSREKCNGIRHKMSHVLSTIPNKNASTGRLMKITRVLYLDLKLLL